MWGRKRTPPKGIRDCVCPGVLEKLWSHRAGRLPVAPAAVDAADLGLRAGEGETLEVWPETVINKQTNKQNSLG